MKKFFLLGCSFFLFFSCKNSNQDMIKAGYSGIDISDSVSIDRDKKTKQATLTVNVQGKWSLYAGNKEDSINLQKPILEGDGKGAFTLDINDSTRTYFQLVTTNGSTVLAESHLPMEGGYNFRDLGGIKTKTGKHVKWGKVFRSDDLNNLTDSDLQYLSSIPLVSIVDFRSEQEISMAPDKNPFSLHTNYPLSIAPGNLMIASDIQSYNPSQIDNLMQELNVLLVTDSSSIEQYRQFFKLLQNENETPLLFHCSAGKDRTGMGAALLLLALDVDQNIVYDNYLASNYFLQDKYKAYIEKSPNLKSLFEVKKEFLQAGIDRIIKDHGSVKEFLIHVLEVDLEKMQKLYLDC